MATKAPADPRLDILERDLQRNVRQFAEGLGWKVHVQWTAIHSPAGWPDLTLYRRNRDGVGELVCIELKREKGKTTPKQDEWIAALASVPGVTFAGVIRPSNWFAGELDGVLR